MLRTEACVGIALSDRLQTLLELNESFWGQVEECPAAACGPARWWNAGRLLAVAMLMAWGKGEALLDRFDLARGVLGKGGGKTYQGFIKALKRSGPGLMAAGAAELRRQVGLLAAAGGLVCGWEAFAVDGSRFDLPRTLAHLEAMGKCGKKEAGPRMWVTMLWHLGAGLPWDWRIDKGDASERHHLRGMAASMPVGSLAVADAGFVGYEVLKEIVGSGRHFLVRVGSNVSLLSKLGHVEEDAVKGIVYLWPDYAQKDRQPPLVLRLIRLRLETKAQNRRKKRGRGSKGRRKHRIRRRWMYLLTSVTDPARLSDADAGKIYRRRWGIEICQPYCLHSEVPYESPEQRSAEPPHGDPGGCWGQGLGVVKAAA